MGRRKHNEFDTVWAPPNRAINDLGAEYTDIQQAIDDSDNMVFIGPGVYEQNILIPDGKEEFVLAGTGDSTFIKGDDDHAIDINADHITLRDLKVSTDPANNVSADGVKQQTGTASLRLSNITVEDSANHGIHIRGINAIVEGFIVKACDRHAINTVASGHKVSGGRIDSGVGGIALDVTSQDSTFGDIVYRTSSNVDNIISCDADRVIFSEMVIIGAGADAVTISGNNSGMEATVIRDVDGDAVVVEGDGNWFSDITTINTTGNPVTDTLATNPRYDNFLADGTPKNNQASPVTDDEHISRLVNSPNASVPATVLDSGQSVEVSVPVPDTETLKVYRWGSYKITDGTTPTGLDVELKDGADTVQASGNTGDTESTDPANPVKSFQNTSGSASIFKLAVANNTSGIIGDPGVAGMFAYVVE